MAIRESLSIQEARRVAIAAQQFAPKPARLANSKQLAELVRRLGVVQMDSVNVLVRSHHLPFFSRRGAYPLDLLARAAYEEPRELFEYWGHEASLLPIELHPLFRWRMEDAQRGQGAWKRLRRYATQHAEEVRAVLDQLRVRGALRASELEGGGKSSGSWWGWSRGKEILEWLFWTGVVTAAARQNFERIYALTERVLPAHVLNAPTPTREAAHRALLTIAAQALGVCTLRDLRDYFRLPAVESAARVQELVEEGTLQLVSVEGWKKPAFLYSQARCPRSIEVDALLSPFDSLIWERQRTQSLFGFTFRLEIYTPADKRVHGYYVLPFLMDERLVARVDLKADREAGMLQVRRGSIETGEKTSDVAERLSAQLRSLAQWLGLERVRVTSRRGDLLKALAKLT